MELFFLNNAHEEAYRKALQSAEITDLEYLSINAPLYLLTSMPWFQVETNLEQVFNFKGKYFTPDVDIQSGFSTGERVLFATAINLYNGYVVPGVQLTPHQALGWLSPEGRRIYLTALEYRYCS